MTTTLSDIAFSPTQQVVTGMRKVIADKLTDGDWSDTLYTFKHPVPFKVLQNYEGPLNDLHFTGPKISINFISRHCGTCKGLNSNCGCTRLIGEHGYPVSSVLIRVSATPRTTVGDVLSSL